MPGPKERGGFEQIGKWRLNSRSTRTLGGSVLKLECRQPSRIPNSKLRKTYRNPVIFALELKKEMSREGLTQVELARKHGLSRARVNQWLSLQKLPEKKIRQILAMGDYWDRRLVTERGLRRLLRSQTYGLVDSSCIHNLSSFLPPLTEFVQNVFLMHDILEQKKTNRIK